MNGAGPGAPEPGDSRGVMTGGTTGSHALGSSNERHEVHGATHGRGSGTTSGSAGPAHQHHPPQHRKDIEPELEASFASIVTSRSENVNGNAGQPIAHQQSTSTTPSSENQQERAHERSEGTVTTAQNRSPSTITSESLLHLEDRPATEEELREMEEDRALLEEMIIEKNNLEEVLREIEETRREAQRLGITLPPFTPRRADTVPPCDELLLRTGAHRVDLDGPFEVQEPSLTPRRIASSAPSRSSAPRRPRITRETTQTGRQATRRPRGGQTLPAATTRAYRVW